MIKELTQAQRNRLPEFRERWRSIGLSTDPADWEQADHWIKEAYTAAGLKPPTHILHVSSPLQAVLTVAALKAFAVPEVMERANAKSTIAQAFREALSYEIDKMQERQTLLDTRAVVYTKPWMQAINGTSSVPDGATRITIAEALRAMREALGQAKGRRLNAITMAPHHTEMYEEADRSLLEDIDNGDLSQQHVPLDNSTIAEALREALVDDTDWHKWKAQAEVIMDEQEHSAYRGTNEYGFRDNLAVHRNMPSDDHLQLRVMLTQALGESLRWLIKNRMVPSDAQIQQHVTLRDRASIQAQTTHSDMMIQGEHLTNHLWESLWESLDEALEVDSKAWNDADNALNEAVHMSARAAVDAEVSPGWNLTKEMPNWVDDALNEALADPDTLSRLCAVAASDAWLDAVMQSAWSYVADHMPDMGNEIMGNFAYGNHDAAWLSFYSFFDEAVGLDCTAPLRPLMELAKHANWWLPYTDIAVVSDKPCAIHFDEQDRLHNPNGLAVEYRDGWGVYAIHGVRIPWEKRHIVEDPNRITVQEIDQEDNAEVRRIMLGLFTEERYVSEIGLKPSHKDKYGELYIAVIPDDEPLTMVKVINSTPEPDNSRKAYWLRVPPDIRTAHAAVAWSFGLTPDQYHPEQES